MDQNSTAYWAKKWSEWWDSRPDKSKKPGRYPKDLKEGYLNAYKQELANGKKSTKISLGGRTASIELRGSGPGDNLKVVYDDTRTVKGGKRRAASKGGAYTFEEMFEYHKKLFPDAPDEDIAVLTHRHLQVNKEELRRLGLIKGETIIREHRNPLSNVEGAGEYYRNIPPDDKFFNAWKSNKIPSDEYLERVGIGRTRFETIQRGLSSPYPRITLDEDRRLIRQDLSAPSKFDDIPKLQPRSKAGFEALEFLGGVARSPGFRRAAAAVPIIGTVVGAASVEANAAERDKEIAANPNDPTLPISKTLDQIAGWGDRTSLAALPAAMTPPGAAAVAAGETVSAVASGINLVLDGGRAVLNTIFNRPKEDPKQRAKYVPSNPVYNRLTNR